MKRKLVTMSHRHFLAEPTIVGREKEMQELQSLLNSAIAGKGKTVFISGEAGSGKSRLSREFLNSAKQRGIAVLAGWCLSNAAVPYFPFFEAFNRFFTDIPNEEIDAASDLTQCLKGPNQPGKVRGMQEISPQVWKDQTFVAVSNTLFSIASKRPVILFVDDVHWADSASLALIHYLARVAKSEKALIVATFRSEELTIDSDGRTCPLVETLRMMRRENLYEEIKVATLDKKDVSTLASNMLGGKLQPEFIEKLAKEGQGNPLFVVESLRMLHERDGLVLQQGNWRLTQDKLEIPDKIKDIILQRLSGLTLSQRKTLEGAAVIGEWFDVQLLAFMLGLELSETVETLDTIGRTTSLVFCEGEKYKFDHARSRDAVYEEISPMLRKVYHAKAAEMLEDKRKEGNLSLGDLFYHYSKAGNKEKAVKYALAAGQDALARWSNAQAIEHFTYALQNLPEVHSEERRTAMEGLGDAYAANGMYKDAVKTFDKLAASETGSLKLRAIRKATDAAYFLWMASDLLLEYCKKAEELGIDDRLEMARILVNRGRAFGWAPSGNSKMDLADSDAALQVFEEEYSLADVATALWRSGLLCTILEGLQEKGLGELLRSVSLFRELEDARGETEATYWTGMGFGSCFLYSEARNAFMNVLKNGEKLGMFAELSLTCHTLSFLDERDGELDRAVTYDLKSIEYGDKTDAMSGRFSAHGGLIRLYSKLEDLKCANEWREKTEKFSSPELRSHFLVAPEVVLTRAVYLAARGEWNESNQIFEKFIENLNKIIVGRPRWEYRARSDYAWALEKQGRFKEAKVQLAEAQRNRRELESRFEHANVQVNVMARRQVMVGEEFEMRLDFVNVGRKPALLVEIRDALLDDFKITSSPATCMIQGNTIKMENKEINAFQVSTTKLNLVISKNGTFSLNPKVIYVNNLGEEKTFSAHPVTITSTPPTPKEKVVGRIPSGTPILDELLLGGIPENYAVTLTSPYFEERESLIRNFLKAGVEAEETTFYVTTDPKSGKDLAEKHPDSFTLFICNLQADAMIQNLPNVFKLKGAENLTDIDIALNKAFRKLKTQEISRRICIEILSDVLLLHHAVNTRRWLSALLPTLKSKGFAILAVVDPSMHPSEELQAILSLFDGELVLSERVTADKTEKSLRVRRLSNQRFLEEEVPLKRPKII
jgi:tetratricopeptide (TPR) repeat protein/archaellum biogenesis ATPase FlaH